MNYGALDFSRYQGLSSFVLDIPENKKHRWVALHWLPEKEINQHYEYKAFVDQGLIRILPDERISWDMTLADIQAVQIKHGFLEICIDPWSGINSLLLQHYGYKAVDYSMTFAMLSEPSHAFLHIHNELLIDNPVLAWMFLNTKFIEDVAGNKKPARIGNKPIGGLVAGIMALGRAMREDYVQSTYVF